MRLDAKTSDLKGGSVEKGSTPKPKKTGTIVMERYEISLSPQEEEQFDRDPYNFARDYLEQNGFRVREIILAQKQGKPLGRWSEGYHIVYPDNSASGWI